MKSVQLGFSEPVASDRVDRSHLGHRSPNFNDWDGGQIGGIPSWLDPEHIPTKVSCKRCEHNMSFLTQIYAPIDFDQDDRAFHRTLYVLICPTCCMQRDTFTGSVRVLRCQLPQTNRYYPTEDAENEVNWTTHLSSTWSTHLCAVCGLKSTKRCPLQNKYFCGREHQKEYKSMHDGRTITSTVGDEDNEVEFSVLLPSRFPLSELVVEEEPPGSEEPSDSRSDGSTQKTPLFPANDVSDDDTGQDDFDQDLEQEDLNDMVRGPPQGASTTKATPTTRDSATEQFFERLQNRPNVQTQCLRYCRWNDDAVLWIQDNHRPTSIPCCEGCGRERKFEFQIMPQLLHYVQKPNHGTPTDDLNSVKDAIQQAESLIQQAPPEQISPALVDAKDGAIGRIQKNLMTQLDWGVIAVFTCTASCQSLRNEDQPHPQLGLYQEEYAWKQPSLDN